MLSDRCLSCLSVCDVGALWPNGWMDQDETWHAGRPRPRTHCVRWGPSSPSPKGAQPPIFGPYLLWPNGCMTQDATGYGGRPRPRRLCVRWGPRSPSSKRERSPLPNFRPISIVAKRLDASRCHGIDVGLSPGDLVLDGNAAPLLKRGRSPSSNFRNMSIAANGCMNQDATCYGCRPRPSWTTLC